MNKNLMISFSERLKRIYKGKMSSNTTHLNYNSHFLDSNILLNLVIRWNMRPEAECKKYIGCSSTKYISDRVHNESENVLDKHRKIAFKYLDFFLEEVNSGRIRAPRDLNHLKRRFLNKYNDQDYPEKIPLNRFINLISAMTLYFETDFINYLYNPSDNTFDILKSQIRTQINDAKDHLDDICQKNLIKQPNSYNNTMGHLETQLLELGLHKPDHLILLDCHCLGINSLKTNMAFITSDNGINHSKSSIESILNNLFVFKP